MKNAQRFFLGALLFCASAASYAAPACATDAVQQARKLLDFHSNHDDRAEVDSDVKELPSIVNPANRAQRFKVLEVWGYVYKGQYRMRLLYYPLGDQCVLMGQEILEHANL